MGSAVKSVENEISKVIPNEVKPVLPYVAMATPWLAGAGYLGAGLEGLAPLESAALGAGANLFSQVATGQAAKRGLNPISLGLSGLGGYLTSPTAAKDLAALGIIGTDSSGNAITAGQSTITGINEAGQPITASGELSQFPTNPEISKLQSLQNVGTQGLSSLAAKAAPVSGQDILTMHTGAQLAPGFVLTASEQARQVALDLNDQYQSQLSNNAGLAASNKNDRIKYVQENMSKAGFSQDDINNALAQLGLGGSGISQTAATQYAINKPLNFPGYGLPSTVQSSPTSTQSALGSIKSAGQILGYAKDGGLMGYAKGGKVKQAERLGYMFGNFVDPAKAAQQALAAQTETENTYKGYLDRGPVSPTVNALKTQLANKYRSKGDLQKQYTNYLTTAGLKPEQITGILSGAQSLKKGGKAEKGLMNLKGHEMDFRDGGGFVPIGKKERADDVPARLSKNEFVFTAKAVRNAGGGDIKEGARRMYHIMKQLEAKA